jgi:MFS family permease
MILQAARRIGAVAVLAVGAVHIQQYLVQNVWAYPPIAILFLLNGIGSGIVGIALLSPLERVLPDRSVQAAIAVLASIALAIAAGSLVFLFISESSGLFGFTETGYRTPVVLAIMAEGVAILLLLPVLVSSSARRLHPSPQPPPGQDGAVGRGIVALRPGK